MFCRLGLQLQLTETLRPASFSAVTPDFLAVTMQSDMTDVVEGFAKQSH